MTKFSNFLYIILFIFSFAYAQISSVSATSYNVLNFGAKPSGETDSTNAFMDAWDVACRSTGSEIQIYVPKGRYLIGPIEFRGPCRSSNIIIRIDGTFVAPEDYRVLGHAHSWFSLKQISGITIYGGRFDANGTSLWACKSSATATNCPQGATTLYMDYCKDIKIRGILSLNSQLFHIAINHCENVFIEGVQIIAASDSPNTDGIHVQLSKDVLIKNSIIKTGDDCISIGHGTKNLWIERIACGPGHGISIGSLGRAINEEGVQNVTVKTIVFTHTKNGFRIKSWARPSNGFVQGVLFHGAVMYGVRNPINIDQNYCPHNLNCPDQVSGIKISDVTYHNIQGTSTSQVAIKFDCSSKYPCTGIRLQDINLKYVNQEEAQSFCANAIGKEYGFVQPESCFLRNVCSLTRENAERKKMYNTELDFE